MQLTAGMANVNPVKDLQDEVTCAICLDHFKDPVSIECGHCFCRACIVQSWRGIRTNFPCPHCRKTSKWKFLRPNRPLENVVEISNRLLLRTEKEECKKQCKKHQEPLKFYCQVDAEEICVICRESVDHRSHVVLPVEETSKEFKFDVQERVKALRSKAVDLKKLKDEEEETALKLQASGEAEVSCTTAPTTTGGKARKKRNVDDATSSFLMAATESLQRQHDEFDGFACMTGHKMRRMTEDQRFLCESLMIKTMQMGIKGQLTETTDVVETAHLPEPQTYTSSWSYPPPSQGAPSAAWHPEYHYQNL